MGLDPRLLNAFFNTSQSMMLFDARHGYIGQNLSGKLRGCCQNLEKTVDLSWASKLLIWTEWLKPGEDNGLVLGKQASDLDRLAKTWRRQWTRCGQAGLRFRQNGQNLEKTVDLFWASRLQILTA